MTVLHLLRPGAEPPPAPTRSEHDEVVPVDELAADELLERVFAAELVIVW